MKLTDIIDTTEAAKILDLGRDRVKQLLLSGELPGRRLGKVWILHAPAIRRIARTRRKWARRRST